MASPSSITVMISGLPGAMGHEVSQACIRRGMGLAEVALTGPGFAGDCEVKESGKTFKVKMVGPETAGDQKTAIEQMMAKYGKGLVMIDFTHPTAVNPNTELYGATKLSYIMGTTGGDRDKMMKVAEESGGYSVIAPNMSKQIVAFQATMEKMASDFPGAFGGYKMDLVESHQSTKADTSGTAVKMVGYFNQLGVEPTFQKEDIKMLRAPEEQKAFGVPEEHLASGHAWHTYTLTSSDGSVQFQFKHNVCGRRTYGEGVADAVQFLADKVIAGSKKRVFSMIDVLSEGKMN